MTAIAQLMLGTSSSVLAFVNPTLLDPNFFDDFELPVGTSALAGRANWTAQDGGGLSQLEVKDGYVHGINQYANNGSAFFGTSVGDQVATYAYFTGTLNGDTFEEGRGYFYLWYQDVNNHCRVEINKGLGRLYIKTVVAGAQSDSHWSGLTFLTSGEIKIFVRNGKFEAMMDGLWCKSASNVYTYPLDLIDFSSTLPGGNKSGRIGFYQSLYRYPILNSVKVEAMGLAVDSVEEFVGRSVLSGANQGGNTKLSMTMAAGASPTSWVYRLLTPGTLAEVKAWAPMTSVAVVGSAVTALAFIPTGGPYIVQAGYVDASDSKARVNYSRPVTCGVLIGVFGQSNAYNRSFGYADVAPLNVKTATAVAQIGTGSISGQPLGGWATFSNAYQGSCMMEMAKTLSTLIGMPVGIFATGNIATTLSYNIPSGGGWATLTNYLAAVRGTVEVMLWDQGEGDTDGGFSPTTYSSVFRSDFLPGLRSATGNSNIWVGISPVGRFASTGTTAPNPSDGAANCEIRRDVLQQQYLDIVANETKVFISDHKLGTLHGGGGADAYHYDNTAQGYPEMGRRAAYTVAKLVYGISTADGTGAFVTSASRTTNVIDLTLNLNGGNAITGPTSLSTGNVPTATQTSLSGFQVSTDNFVTTLAISSVTLVSGKIRITLAANPGAAVKIRSHYGWSYDDTVLFYTTYADGRANIPVAPIRVAVTAA